MRSSSWWIVCGYLFSAVALTPACGDDTEAPAEGTNPTGDGDGDAADGDGDGTDDDQQPSAGDGDAGDGDAGDGDAGDGDDAGPETEDEVGAPQLPSTSASDYTWSTAKGGLNVYWRAASDTETDQAALEYRVSYRKTGGAELVALDWSLPSSLAVEASGRFYTLLGLEAVGSYEIWVSVRDQDGHVTSFPTLTAAVAGPDFDAPALPSFGDSDYTHFAPGINLLIYWRAASDEVTSANDLEYQVTCLPDGGTPIVSLAWTKATLLTVEGSGRYYAQACSGPGQYTAWVTVRDAAGNETEYPPLTATVYPPKVGGPK